VFYDVSSYRHDVECRSSTKSERRATEARKKRFASAVRGEGRVHELVQRLGLPGVPEHGG
jgi:hypothetical protein